MARKFMLGSLAAACLAAVSFSPFLGEARAASAGDLPIAVQMYTLRDYGTLDEQFAAVEAAGVTAVETVGTQKTDASTLKGLLEAHGIAAISTHAPLADLRGDLDGVIAFNKTIGNTTIVMPWLMPEQRPTDAAGWRAFGEELGGIAAKLKAEGMTFAYHNHDFEMAEFDGRTALEILTEAAGPDLKVELDVAWVARGGQDPAEYPGRFAGRVFAIHAKDNAPKGEAPDERGFQALGQGVLDWDAILPAAEKAGTHWYIIEHDMPLDAAAVVKTGADFLAEMLPEGAMR